jgi:hypothetical protein
MNWIITNILKIWFSLNMLVTVRPFPFFRNSCTLTHFRRIVIRYLYVMSLPCTLVTGVECISLHPFCRHFDKTAVQSPTPRKLTRFMQLIGRLSVERNKTIFTLRMRGTCNNILIRPQALWIQIAFVNYVMDLLFTSKVTLSLCLIN